MKCQGKVGIAYCSNVGEAFSSFLYSHSILIECLLQQLIFVLFWGLLFLFVHLGSCNDIFVSYYYFCNSILRSRSIFLKLIKLLLNKKSVYQVVVGKLIKHLRSLKNYHLLLTICWLLLMSLLSKADIKVKELRRSNVESEKLEVTLSLVDLIWLLLMSTLSSCACVISCFNYFVLLFVYSV